MRIRALVFRIWRQFLHDKRTLALMLLAPLFVMTLISLVFNGSTYKPKIGLIHVPVALSQQLAKESVTLSSYASSASALSALKNQSIDAYVDFHHGQLAIKLEGSNPSTSQAVLMNLQKLTQPAITRQALSQPTVSYLYGSASMTSFDNFGPVLIGFFAFFFVFLVAGISFLNERTTGTLDRLLATPIKRYEVVLGYVLGYGAFTIVQAFLIAWFSVDILGMMMTGSLFTLLIVTLLLSMSALTFGIFISSFANSEFQIMQFIPIVVVPQIFFSGLFNIATMAPWLRWLSYLMPLYYGAEAMRNVMIRGKGIDVIGLDLLFLLALSLVFIVLNVFTLRKYRKV